MADVQNPDFVKSIARMLAIEEDAVEELISMLDADALIDLNDAVANGDKKHAEEIIDSVDTDEDVNPLFRGDNISDKNRQKKRKHRRRVGRNYEYNHGDDVQVLMTEPNEDRSFGHQIVKRRWEDGTVYLPHGPDDTVGVKIQGKSKMVDRDKVRKLEEQVLGMVGIPSLDRMQQLAGIQPAGIQQQPTPEVAVEAPHHETETDPCTAAQQAMAALDVVETVLPNVRLADLKTIRQRILALQSCMNESA